MDVSTYLRNQLRAHVFRTATFAKPAALYISLHCGSCGLDGANEVTTSGTGYLRVQRNPLDANWTAEATDGLTKNVAAITFPTPSGNWNKTGGLDPAVSITHVGLWDAASSGNFLGGFPLAAAKTVNNGDPAPTIPVSELTYQFRDPTE